MSDSTEKFVEVDEGAVQAHLGEMVRSTAEEMLNAMLDTTLKIRSGGRSFGFFR